MHFSTLTAASILVATCFTPLAGIASPGITLQDSFTGSNGAYPDAALTAAGNGLYYGSTTFGGANDLGAIFSFDSGIRGSNPVPGPLPIVGIGAAFGWSRQLRRRVAQANPRKA